MVSETRHIETVPHSLSGQPLTGYKTTTVYLPYDYTPQLMVVAGFMTVLVMCAVIWMLKRMIVLTWIGCGEYQRMLQQREGL